MDIEKFELPLVGVDNTRFFALDLGGSLLKIVYVQPTNVKEGKTEFNCVKFPNTSVPEALGFILVNILGGKPVSGADEVKTIGIGIGVGAMMISGAVKQVTNVDLLKREEFTSQGKALAFHINNMKEEEYILPYHDFDYDYITQECLPRLTSVPVESREDAEIGLENKYPLLLCVAGSDTVYLKIEENGRVEIMGMNYVGGIVLQVLGNMLCGAQSFIELCELAHRGSTENVHLFAKEVINEQTDQYSDFKHEQIVNLPFDSMAYFLGKLTNEEVRKYTKKEDLAAGIMDLVVDNIFTHVVQLSKITGSRKIYFTGNMFFGNERAKKYLERLPHLSHMYGHPVYARVIKCFGYLGAIGSIISEIETM